MTTRKSGTIFWLNVILDHEELGPTDTLLLIALADHVDERDVAWPSLRTLARRTRVSYATVRRHMDELVAAGFVERSARRRADGGRSTDQYRLVRRRFGLGDGDRVPSPDPDEPRPPAQIEQGVCSDRARPPAHPGERAEVPSSEPEEEEERGDQQLPDLADAVVDQVAARLLEDRNADLPAQPVRQPGPWLQKARRRVRRDVRLRRAAVAARHPSLGGRCHPDAVVEVVAHVHRTGEYPAPPRRRRIEIIEPPAPSTEEPTPMPDSVRATRDSLGHRR